MKKLKISMMAIFAVLFSCLFVMGCDDPKPNAGTEDEVYAQGKIIILQAYGNAGDGSPEGVSHSFVELYNITDEDISLDGIGLYYANGTSVASGQTNTATKDGEWKRISLDGKTIPAKGSFLILGAKHSNLNSTRYKIDDNYGDINDNNLSLSRRGFKAALLESTADLTVQNPFTSNNGNQIDGYIDMVGAANNYQGRDLIFGFETAPARNSASEAVRRTDLIDYDDNSTDFIAARYALSDGGMSNEELEVSRPRNSSAGDWDPFEEPGEPLPPENPTVAGTPSPLAGQLLILQVYGTGTDTDGAVSHSFIELYNNTDSPINLSTYSLQYANTTGTNWTVINLTGTIPAKGSYLVRGNNNNKSGRLQLDAADQNAEFYLDNRNFKAALMANQNKLTVENPFAMTGGKAKDYVDMVGVKNGNNDNIDGFEAALAQVISKQAAARRGSLTDSDNNSTDFVRLDYRILSGNNGISDEELEVRKPRTSSAGNWNPFEEPEYPIVIPTDNTLLILQIGAATDGNISRSFVELYNNGDAAVNLSGYSLQYAEGTRETEVANRPNTNTEDGPWAKIDLSGTIPPQHSFLILGDEGIGQMPSTNPALALTAGSGDMNVSFVISNRSFKVALMGNTTLLTVQNPFDTDGAGTKAAGYVDMVGAMNTVGEDKINGYEGSAVTNLNKQTGQRRTSLVDTNNNANDFTRATYADASPADIEKLTPKNLEHGEWDPFADPEPPEYQTTAGTPSPLAGQLLILQAGAATNGAIARNFVELYNNTDSPITLTGTYSLQYAGATGTDWTVINLDGTIPAHGSFLVVGKVAESHNDNRLFIADNEADQIAGDSFILSNNGFKVALMANQQKLTVANPFAMEGGKAADYVDMLGAYNSGTQPDGYETAHAAVISKQAAARRSSLTDTDNNSTDFVRIDYRVQSGNNGISDDDLAKFRPRHLGDDTWTPEF